MREARSKPSTAGARTAGRPRVVLVTNAFPFPSGEDAFLPVELEVLAGRFDVVVLPIRGSGPLPPRHLPGAVVDDRLARRMGGRGRLLVDLARASLSPLAWRQVAMHPSLWVHPVRLMKAWKRLATAVGIARWTRTVLAPQLRGTDAVVYCWWSAWTFAGIVVGLRGTGVPMVSRAHGFDLYDAQSDLGFCLLRDELVRRVDRVDSVSEAGARYLRRSHPAAAGRIGVARLGTRDHGLVNVGSLDGVLRIVSCSHVVKVKRLDLLVESLAVLLASRPHLRFTWTHLGGGPLARDVREMVDRIPALRERVRLLGALRHEEVMAHYATHPVDLLVNLSASEGVPVSLIEAASFGIPILATAVGGTPELVGPAGGWLLPADVAAAGVADAIAGIASLGRGETNAVRSRGREAWRRLFFADENYGRHADMLAAVARGVEPQELAASQSPSST